MLDGLVITEKQVGFDTNANITANVERVFQSLLVHIGPFSPYWSIGGVSCQLRKKETQEVPLQLFR